MKIVIVEDEYSAVENLKFALKELDIDVQIVNVLDTVTDAITFFKSNADFDIIFMDIHLADGHSFEILNEINPEAPIIFITAFNQYAIKAFKYNSIDYLLKPINTNDLRSALDKFNNQNKSKKNSLSSNQIEGLLDLLKDKNNRYRKSFLIQIGESYVPMKTLDFSYFFIQNGIVYGRNKEGKSFIVDQKLEELEQELNPNNFFRANRQFLIGRNSIEKLSSYFNGRTILHITPIFKEEIVVSKANSSRLKKWLNKF